MEKSKRLIFLESYLKFFGVEKIELIEETLDFVTGIAIYDVTDTEERQEFIWYISETDTPSSQLNTLIEKIHMNKLHNGDKISNTVEQMDFPEFNRETQKKLLNELFDIEIRMIDNGKETDSFFVHT